MTPASPRAARTRHNPSSSRRAPSLSLDTFSDSGGRPESRQHTHTESASHTPDAERGDPYTYTYERGPGPTDAPSESEHAAEDGRGTAARKRGAHYAALVPAAVLGCLIRLGLEALGRCE